MFAIFRMRLSQLIGIIFLLIITCGCESISHDEMILGHWYACSRNGDYVELHIKDHQYKYSSDFGVVSQWNEFIINGDTLIQYDKFVFEDSIVTYRARLHLTDKGELKLDYFTSDENWTFLKISERPRNIENNLILKQETLERSRTRKCVDQRTEAEIKQDSLNNIFDFQF